MIHTDPSCLQPREENLRVIVNTFHGDSLHLGTQLLAGKDTNPSHFSQQRPQHPSATVTVLFSETHISRSAHNSQGKAVVKRHVNVHVRLPTKSIISRSLHTFSDTFHARFPMDDVHKQNPNKLIVVIKETLKRHEPFFRFIEL
jgi:hypothetical protein